MDGGPDGDADGGGAARAGGSPLSQFLDAFLQPRNIKWLLVAGVLILLASSLMLVGAHWQSYAPAWKYLVLLGYTAGTWLAIIGLSSWLVYATTAASRSPAPG